MVNNQSYLKLLVGKVLTKTGYSTSTVFPIKVNENDNQKEIMTISLELHFEEYLLYIYNPVFLVPSDKEILDFVGLEVIATNENKEEAILSFNSNYKLIVNMRDEAYYDLEAMCLYGPNNFCAVWN